MLRWLKNKAGDWASRTQEREIRNFIAILRKMDGDELGRLIANSAILRERFSSTGVITYAALDSSRPRDIKDIELYDLTKLTSIVISYIKNDNTIAEMATKVILYSVQALIYDNLRELGRSLWAELERGFPSTEREFGLLLSRSNGLFDESVRRHLSFVPVGLEPRKANAKNVSEQIIPLSLIQTKIETKVEMSMIPGLLAEVKNHLMPLGYVMNQYGVAVAGASLLSGYSAAETASLIAITTFALEVKINGTNLTEFNKLHGHARSMLDVLVSFRDAQIMRVEIFRNDGRALVGLAILNPEPAGWVDKILSDPVAGKERLATRSSKRSP